MKNPETKSGTYKPDGLTVSELRTSTHPAGYAFFNPHNKPIEELPVIYGFNNGGSQEWFYAVLLAEDGTALGSHVCSHEGYMRGDLGVLDGHRADRHETFKQHYPDGYRMDFVPAADVPTHAGLIAAYKKNQEIAALSKASDAGDRTASTTRSADA